MSISINKQCSACRQAQKGYSLLEVLIALLILSIGMLGVAGLQVASARYVYEAKIRNGASVAINEVVNRIQANAFDLPPYGFLRASPSEPVITEIVTAYLNAAPAAVCSPLLSTPENDLGCLNEAITTNLPNGSYTLAALDNRTVQLTVTWYNRDLQADVNTTWNIRF